MRSLLLAVTLGLLSQSTLARAGESSPDAHYVRVSVAGSEGGARANLEGPDLHFYRTSGMALGFDAQVAVVATKALEVDVRGRRNGESGDMLNAYLGSVGIRYGWRVGSNADIGLRFGLGWATMAVRENAGDWIEHPDTRYSGLHSSLGVDYRHWVTPALALSLGAELAGASMHAAHTPTYYDGGSYGTFGLRLAVTYGL